MLEKEKIDKSKLRNVPGWKNAPVPTCMGGDYRALTFCCKPGYSLTFGFKCLRDKSLKEVGITPEEFVKIKEEFSKKNNWDSDIVCFGSISYCCMRAGGCERRDPALLLRYKDIPLDKVMETYFTRKKELSQIIIEHITNPEAKEKIKRIIKELQDVEL